MQDNFAACIKAVWQFDGVKDDEAPGENFVTTYGITAGTWSDAVAAGIVNKAQRNCTPDDAIAILKALYWEKTTCDDWHAGVDLMVFDFAMMAGIRPSIECLQLAAGLDGEDVDGIVGFQTMTEVAKGDPRTLIPALRQYHLEHLCTLRNWGQFKGGWTRRQNTMRDLALKMAGV